jgi:hypothetical protein
VEGEICLLVSIHQKFSLSLLASFTDHLSASGWQHTYTPSI